MSAGKWIGLALLAGLAYLGWQQLFTQDAIESDPLPLPAPSIRNADQTPPAAAFVDITTPAGVTFARNNGAQGQRLLPETMGGGVALFDYDNDGLVDLFLPDGGDWPGSDERKLAAHRLYRNLGDGTFADRSTQSNVQLDFYAVGAAVADVDADGWMDLLLTGIGGTRLLRNNQGRFVDATQALGLSGEPNDWSTAAVFFDADNDGDLDLYVANYVQWSPELDLALGFQLAGFGRAYGPPMNFPGSRSRLYLQAEDGRFADLSESSGIHMLHPTSGEPIGKALGVMASDVNDDGMIDLMVANDTVRNFLFLNRGEGRFDEVGSEWGLAFDRDGTATGAMGIDGAWLGREPRHAFFLGNFANEMSSLYVAQPGLGLYSDDAIIEGLGPASRQVLTFGTLFLDYDLDGRLDLLQTNGHLEEAIEQVQSSQQYRQPGQLFWNCGELCSRRFIALDNESIGDLAKPMVGRGSAYADFDGDGDLDLLIAAASGEPLLLRNDQATSNAWIAVRLRSADRNRDALGARLSLHLADAIQQRDLITTRGYLSAVQPIAHFGLGAAASIERLEIRWPNGSVQTVDGQDLRPGQLNLITPQGVLAENASARVAEGKDQ